ncbi:MAG: dephospho-CoA kinase [Hyphomicrobiaceae bacterium]
MFIIGLTGSIGMGKSTAAEKFRSLGIGVFDADAQVHALYAGRAVPLIETAFPGTTAGGVVDRAKLAAALGGRNQAFARVEAIVHPLVRDAERAFLRAEQKRGARYAVLEIPLLFETGADKLADAVIVVSADAATQRARVMARPGMTAEKFEAIFKRQTSDAEKRARADFVVDTTGTITDTQAQIEQILQTLAGRTGTAFARVWGA